MYRVWLHRSSRSAFSMRRSLVMAGVLLAHAMALVWLLAPAAPWRTSRAAPARARVDDDGLVLVFYGSGRAYKPHGRRRESSRRVRGHRRGPGRRAPHAVPPTRSPSRHLALSVPVPDDAGTDGHGRVPEYIAGGRAFRRRLAGVLRRQQRRLLPADDVPGMPHFAMRDSRTTGVAGIAHAITNILGAQDPVCIEAGTEIAMSDRQLAARYLSRDEVEHVALEHRCQIRKRNWMAPSGPATQLSVRPPGHGVDSP